MDLALKYRNQINDKLLEISKIYNNNPEISDSIKYTLLNNGKLARSVIILLGLNALNIDSNKGLDVACALEMIQSYTLIHDDLPEMDDASIRRGKATNHLVYGHGVALLAGDALLTDSFYVLSRTNLDSDQKCKLIELFSKKAGGLGVCYGQVLDIMNENNYFSTWEEIKKIISLKTCALFELAFSSIGIIAKFDESKINILEKIGYSFGLAFQIQDDLNDYLKEQKEIGKDNAQDENKCLYHKIYGVDKAIKEINSLLKQIKEDCENIFGIDNYLYQYLLSLIK